VSARVVWDGLREFYADLRNLPAELRGEAGVIVMTVADEARTAIRAEYAEKSGNLRKGLVVRRFEVGAYGAGVEIRNTAKHAWLYEHGSNTRRNRFGNRGKMPANPVFGRIMPRKRREMVQRLAAMMRAHGLTVTVHAA